ncbi:MAG: catechol 2,3-dioxygenase-like lactoylglutathione lyase family enzyme [Alphaproteobacteria bacterium]|jgi:catechol 2,3-dioxygenase-like lactoylglutathione lyase family enzyme
MALESNRRAKVRHIAIKTPDPQRLAEYYTQVFGLEVVLRRETGSVYLSDGDLCLALLPTRGECAPGIEHFGFHIQDAEEIAQALEDAGQAPPKVRPNDPPYAETRVTDPDGNMIDLSEHGFEMQEFQDERVTKTTAK